MNYEIKIKQPRISVIGVSKEESGKKKIFFEWPKFPKFNENEKPTGPCSSMNQQKKHEET